MARIRTIKPEFWLNEDISELSAEACLLAVALLNYSDDEGYFNANLSLVRASCFPLRKLRKPLETLMDQLLKIGYIDLGLGSNGRRYGRVIKFTEHQNVNRPYSSKIKALWKHSLNDHGTLSERSVSAHPPLIAGTGNREQGTGNREQGAVPRDFFEGWWKEYPRKIKKEKAWEAWQRLGIGSQMLPKMIETLRTQKASKEWTEEGGKFVPHPTTYLNQQRWTDELSDAERGDDAFRRIMEG
jgi:hypothetical protein